MRLSLYTEIILRKRLISVYPQDLPALNRLLSAKLRLFGFCPSVDARTNGSDTGETDTKSNWTRQNPGIEIDEEHDIISDKGQEVYSLLKHREIEWLLIMGVHTTMCILHRSFAIVQMVRSRITVVHGYSALPAPRGSRCPHL